jgi:hypothetical protein
MKKLNISHLLRWIVFLPIILPIFLVQAMVKSIFRSIVDLIALMMSDCLEAHFENLELT